MILAATVPYGWALWPISQKTWNTKLELDSVSAMMASNSGDSCDFVAQVNNADTLAVATNRASANRAEKSPYFSRPDG